SVRRRSGGGYDWVRCVRGSPADARGIASVGQGWVEAEKRNSLSRIDAGVYRPVRSPARRWVGRTAKRNGDVCCTSPSVSVFGFLTVFGRLQPQLRHSGKADRCHCAARSEIFELEEHLSQRRLGVVEGVGAAVDGHFRRRG